jgi:hypothetical protein
LRGASKRSFKRPFRGPLLLCVSAPLRWLRLRSFGRIAKARFLARKGPLRGPVSKGPRVCKRTGRTPSARHSKRALCFQSPGRCNSGCHAAGMGCRLASSDLSFQAIRTASSPGTLARAKAAGTACLRSSPSTGPCPAQTSTRSRKVRPLERRASASKPRFGSGHVSTRTGLPGASGFRRFRMRAAAAARRHGALGERGRVGARPRRLAKKPRGETRAVWVSPSTGSLPLFPNRVFVGAPSSRHAFLVWSASSSSDFLQFYAHDIPLAGSKQRPKGPNVGGF